MTQTSKESYWADYREKELAFFTPLLAKHGYTLDDEQPHIYGERYLMHAVTTQSGTKLILLGKNNSGVRVVIKVTRDRSGMREILHERTCRKVLAKLNFAYGTFASPTEIDFIQKPSYIISAQEYIDQKCMFIERPIEEQFDFALRAFKAQESAHATTANHIRLITSTFGSRDADDYLSCFKGFVQDILFAFPEYEELLKEASAELEENRTIIEQYCGFLTHVDFVPHNFRIKDKTLYLLDQSSLRFGNKYEGWARFINFMTLYNPELARLLTQYVKDNRTEEETISLQMMRLYRLTELMFYYTHTLAKSNGSLKKLNTERVHFWAEVLKSVLKKEGLSETIRNSYTEKRDDLRTEEEKKRQVGLH